MATSPLPVPQPRRRPLTPRRTPFELVLAFAISCALLLLLIAAVITGGTPPTAAPHPELAPMLRATGQGGGPGWAGWVVGLLVIALMGTLIALGVRRRARRLRRWVWAAIGGYALVFGLLMLAARAYDAGSTAGFGGFPAPTAWLIYGIALFPAVLLALLVRHFETAFFDDADQARFDEILRRAADGSAGAAGPAAGMPPGGLADPGEGASPR